MLGSEAPILRLATAHCKSRGARLRSPRRDDRIDDRKAWRDMALGIYFVHQGFTPEIYKQALSKLEAAGEGSPKGRTYHVALESNGEIQVFDIWESQED